MPKIPEKPADKARRQLIKWGYEKDELDTQFKTDEALLEFFEEIKKERRKATTAPDDEDDEPEDSYRLPKDEARALDKQREIEAKTALREANSDPAQRAAFDAAQSKQEPKEKVSYDDFLQSLEDGMSADDSDVPNN